MSGLSLNQQAMAKLPFNHGTMDGGGSGANVVTAPVGSWLLRFSTSQNQMVISTKVEDKKFVHYRTIIDGKNAPLTDQIRALKLDGHKVIKPGTAPSTSTKPEFDTSEEGLRQSAISAHKKDLGPISRSQAEQELFESLRRPGCSATTPSSSKTWWSMKPTVGTFRIHPTTGVTMEQITAKYGAMQMQGRSSDGVRTPTPLEKCGAESAVPRSFTAAKARGPSRWSICTTPN